MNILFLAAGRPPRFRAQAGGDLAMFQSLAALSKLGHQVHLAVPAKPSEIEDEVRELCASVSFLVREPSGLEKAAQRIFPPSLFSLRTAKLWRPSVAQLARSVGADLIWAEASLSVEMVPRGEIPFVYVHHDFQHKLQEVRKSTRPSIGLDSLPAIAANPRKLREHLHRPSPFPGDQLRELEERSCSESSVVVSVSSSATDTIREFGGNPIYIPLAGATIEDSDLEVAEKCRLLLFGNHNTANRAVLSEVRAQLWDRLADIRDEVEWHQVGRVRPGEIDSDWTWASENFDAMHGFVDDLRDIFRPGDLCLVPYPYDTGTRAKFAVLAAYRVPSAGYAKSFACAPEYTDGEDCLFSPDADSLAQKIRDYVRDKELRTKLSSNVRALYEREFAFEALISKYEAALELAAG